VRTGLDDITDFDKFSWNGWVPREDYPAEIVLEQGEYFVKSKSSSNFLALQKLFNEIEIGESYEFSFQYKCPVDHLMGVYQDNLPLHYKYVPASSTWCDFQAVFSKNTFPASPMLMQIQLGYAPGSPIGSSQLDNIRLRHIPK